MRWALVALIVGFGSTSAAAKQEVPLVLDVTADLRGEIESELGRELGADSFRIVTSPTYDDAAIIELARQSNFERLILLSTPPDESGFLIEARVVEAGQVTRTSRHVDREHLAKEAARLVKQLA